MELKIGAVECVKLGLFKSCHKFEAGDRGFVLEKDHGAICLYATDAAHEKIYCAMPMGAYKDLKLFHFYIFCHDERKLLCGVGRALFVVDFAEKWASTNVENFHIFGSDHWGESCQRPWDRAFLKLFGIPDEDAGMDIAAAERFWQWFAENEETIAEKLGGQNAMEVVNMVDRRITSVFPYAPGEAIQFQLGWNEGRGEFFFYHAGHKKLMTDGEALGNMMPEDLKQRWSYKLEK